MLTEGTGESTDVTAVAASTPASAATTAAQTLAPDRASAKGGAHASGA